MKDFLRFLQSLNNVTEAYLSTDREGVNEGVLILYYRGRTDNYLSGEVKLLQGKLDGKENSITIKAGSKKNHYDIIISVYGKVQDGFTLIDVNINHAAIEEIEAYLENSAMVALALKNQSEARLSDLFTLYLDTDNYDTNGGFIDLKPEEALAISKSLKEQNTNNEENHD